MSYGFTSCSECGVILPHARLDDHACEEDTWIAYQVARARPEIEKLEHELAAYLSSVRGRFDLWYAERTRLRAA